MMTRNDRAAVRLAYECLRSGADVSVIDRALSCGTPDGVAWGIAHAVDRAWRLSGDFPVARIALLCRALLRADAGDCGPWTWSCEGARCRRGGGEVSHWGDCGGTSHRRIRPLWENCKKPPLPRPEG